ncbi:MAG: aromatic ring-hydroxylating dioxygenase subunit alpha [Candidatus Tectomicrobia bacterium]|nr:aromatic ring-hydroxylating dioxygenase subunit alpha [Candidatus Tectomicrobia bacterium]
MGTIALENLVIDNTDDGLFRVNRRVFTDPAILEAEKQGVFDQSWIYAGHESEIPEPGDFRARDVAGRPTILARGSDGQVRALLNTCTHRGSLVCRQSSGNSKSFQCPYHAWTFSNQGDLIGVPGEDAYGTGFDRQELGLATAPRMASYRGFIFVNFNPDADDLIDYLAGAREYLDLICDQSEAGMEVVSGTQEYCMRANWKLLVENSIDGYHAPITHQRYIEFLYETGVDRGFLQNRWKGQGLALGNGHSVIVNSPLGGRPIAHWTPMFGEEKKAEFEAIRQTLAERYGEERAYKMTQTSRNLFIFPNLIINDIMAITIRTFYPSTPDYMDITAWALAPKDESADNRRLRLDNFLTFLGPGGFATPDDVEMLEGCQKGFANREVGWSDISRGMQRDEPWSNDELQIRTFWRKWHESILQAQPEPGLAWPTVAV